VRGLDGLLHGRADPAPVFTDVRTAAHLRNHVFRNGWFDSASTTVGLDGPTPHELRHTAASPAVGAGSNVKAVQRMLSHASAAMRLHTSADLFDADLTAVADALDHRAMRRDVASRPLMRRVAIAPGNNKPPG
jgi:integrase